MEVMEIPPELFDEFKFANQEMCENDPLMPKFSPEMCYVTASKTHVAHDPNAPLCPGMMWADCGGPHLSTETPGRALGQVTEPAHPHGTPSNL